MPLAVSTIKANIGGYCANSIPGSWRGGGGGGGAPVDTPSVVSAPPLAPVDVLVLFD